MVALSIATNALDVTKKLKQLQRSIPKVTSRSMQLASEKARDDARESAKKRFKDPRPATIKAIKNSYPSRGGVIGGKANASVFIASFLVDELHPTVFDRRETNIPKSGEAIISPTQDFRVNKYGNIPGLRNKSLGRRIEQEEKYLNVPLNNKNPKSKHLPPGLYQFKGRSKNKKLVMIISYRKFRKSKAVWREYPKVVRKSFDKNFPKLYRKTLLREIGKLV